MKSLRVLFFGILAFALAEPAIASAQQQEMCGLGGVPGCESIFLADATEPGSVLVFPKFERETFLEAEVGDLNVVHAKTELEISVVCPKGETCGRNPITGKFERVFMRAHWVCPGFDAPSNTEVHDRPAVCRESSFDLETTVNGTLYFNPEGVTVMGAVITAAAEPSNVTTTILPPPCLECPDSKWC